MSNSIVIPTETFDLLINGNIEQIEPNDYYFLQEDGKIVLKHNKLVQIAEKNNVKVDKTILEYGIYTNSANFYFCHRSFGKLPNGDMVDEVGDASPDNCTSKISKSIPSVMSDKRSKDKLLIRLLGIRDKVYSDCEIMSNDVSTSKLPTLMSSLENAPNEQTRLEIAENAKIDFSSWKNNPITMKDALNMYLKRINDVFSFLVTLKVKEKYPNGNPKMEYLHSCAVILYSANKDKIQEATVQTSEG